MPNWIPITLHFVFQFIMRKRQTRFNYGERCRPVSLDAYSLDSVSAYNSVRRKGAPRSSKRSYGNPTFEDAVSDLLLASVYSIFLKSKSSFDIAPSLLSLFSFVDTYSVLKLTFTIANCFVNKKGKHKQFE